MGVLVVDFIRIFIEHKIYIHKGRVMVVVEVMMMVLVLGVVKVVRVLKQPPLSSPPPPHTSSSDLAFAAAKPLHKKLFSEAIQMRLFFFSCFCLESRRAGTARPDYRRAELRLMPRAG